MDEEMDAAAGVVAGHARKTEAFPHDALPRKGGVDVDQHRQHLLLLGQIVAVDLLRAYLAEHDRIDRHEVPWVGDELPIDDDTVEPAVGSRADGIFSVASPSEAFGFGAPATEFVSSN